LASQNVDSQAHESNENKYSNIEQVEVLTGEEDEITVQQLRAKLYTMDPNHQYKERGLGTLRLNIKKSDKSKARLVMRAEGVFRLLLNANLFHGMACSVSQDPKFIKISVLEDGVTVHHAIKVSNAKLAKDLVDQVLAHIPAPESPEGSDGGKEEEKEKEKEAEVEGEEAV